MRLRSMACAVVYLGIAGLALAACGGAYKGQVVTDDVNLAHAEAAKRGYYGLRCDIMQTSAPKTAIVAPIPRHVVDDSPPPLTRYGASFWMRLDAAGLQEDDEIHVLTGQSSDQTKHFRVAVLRSAGQNHLRVYARLNTGAKLWTAPGPTTVLPAGYNHITVEFDTVAGRMRASINGIPGPVLTGLAMSQARIDAVRFGIVTGVTSATTVGYIDFDDYAQMAPATLPVLTAVDGLPPGTTFTITQKNPFFVNLAPGGGMPGGGLGGEMVSWAGHYDVEIGGTGSLAGWNRVLMTDSATMTVDTGPGTGTPPTMTYPLDMTSFGGPFPPGDPDFAVLSVQIGTAFALPATTGTLTVTQQNPGIRQLIAQLSYTVQITFVGAPGGALDGLAGSTTEYTGIISFQNGLLFADGFESGDATAWSDQEP